jgi:membrane associated rhomboid family serine protease
MFFPIRDDQPSYSTPFVNYFIIGLNALVFIFELSVQKDGPDALNALVSRFGMVPRNFELALAGSAHYNLAAVGLTIFTSMFLHAGWQHIIGNMWILWIFGDNIEDYLGHFQYLLFYLLCGLAAGVTHILLNFGASLPTVGASGAIAGVMGAYLLLYPRAKVLTWVAFIFFFWLPAWIWLGGWFLLQFYIGTTLAAAGHQASGGIAVWAHVGGFAMGLILIKLLPQRAIRQRYASW